MEEMVAPPPGRMPRKNPSTEPRPIAPEDWRRSAREGQTLATRSGALTARWRCSRLCRISPSPNRPMATGTKSMPSARLRFPKVKRSAPVKTSRPTVASSSPKHAATSALVLLPLLMVATSRMPSSARAAYSGGPKSRAKPATSGARKVSPTMATVPPTKEPMAAMPRAVPARPCLART
ncbi:hypothetical protein AUQ48_05310 [Kocuria flava]|uniref:Uncharacterized protein n=1 Tax=Kocuria flava TaxID=446860 RepID=A0A2N4T0L9_9MICC|nr:hypothetical protein AUQ48_05310 [Kocuria flava]